MIQLKYFLIISLLLLSIKVKSQFEPLEFDDYEPVWMHYFFDSTAVGFYEIVGDGMKHLQAEPQIIREGDSIIYVLYKIIVTTFHGNGGFIQKLDIKNQQVLWTNYFDLRNNDKYENPSIFFINEDEDIEILGFRSKEVSHFSAKSKFMRRKYDKETGELLEHYYANESDTLAPFLFSDTGWQDSQLFPEEDEIKYVSRTSYDTSGYIHKYIYDLNEMGQTLDMHTLLGEVLLKYNLMGGRFYKVNDEEFFNYQRCINSSNSFVDSFDYRIFLQYYDRDFVLDRQYEVTDIIKLGGGADFFLYYVDDKYINLTLWEMWEPLHWRTRFYIFNHQGEAVDSFYMVTPDGWYMNHCLSQRISEDEFLFGGSTRWRTIGAKNTMHFFKKRIGGELEQIKQFSITKENHFLIMHQIVPLENGDILFFGRHGFTKVNMDGVIRDNGGGWNVMIYFPAEDIGLTTGTEETTQSPRMEIELYPNPASNQIELALASRVSGYVQIFDILGREVIRKTVEDQDHITVATGHLETGNYFVKLYDNKKNLLGAKSFVKGR